MAASYKSTTVRFFCSAISALKIYLWKNKTHAAVIFVFMAAKYRGECALFFFFVRLAIFAKKSPPSKSTLICIIYKNKQINVDFVYIQTQKLSSKSASCNNNRCVVNNNISTWPVEIQDCTVFLLSPAPHWLACIYFTHCTVNYVITNHVIFENNFFIIVNKL